MSKYQSIINIRNARDKIREEIKSIDKKDFKDQTFGPENEYTYLGLIGGIDSLMTDISTLTQYESRFIKLSSYNDRKVILNCLNNILSNLNRPNNLYPHVDQLKTELRNYNIRSFSENLIQFETEIDDVIKLKTQLLDNISEVNSLKDALETEGESISDINTVATTQLEEINNKFENIESKLNEIIEKSTETENLNVELESIKSKANKNLSDITTLKTESESNKKLIDVFAENVQEKENNLVELQSNIEINNNKLNEYEKEREKIIKQAQELINSAKQALNYKTAEGLSASFDAQYTDAKDNRKLNRWIIGAAISLGVTLALGLFVLMTIQDEWFIVLGRILLLPIPISAAIFCSQQYVKQKNIIEDYAYKTTIAKSIVGFSEQLRKNGNDSDEEYVNYIKKALDEIHKDPLRNRKEVSNKENLPQNIDQFIEILKKINTISSGNPSNQ